MPLRQWSLQMQAIHVLWQRAFPRVLAGEWGGLLNKDYGIPLPINKPDDDPLDSGKRLKDYILAHDNKQRKTDELLLGGGSEILENIELRIYSEEDFGLRDRFLIYEAGIALPWPKRPRKKDLPNVYARYEAEFAGLTSINIPGLKTLPLVSPLPTPDVNINILHANVSYLFRPIKRKRKKQHESAIERVKKELEKEKFSIFIKDDELYELFIRMPRIVARAWDKINRTRYNKIRRNKLYKEFLERDLGKDPILDDLPLTRIAGFSTGQELVIENGKIYLPLLPEYPDKINDLFKSWYKGESHNPMFSNTPTS